MLETLLLSRPEVTRVASFMGRSAPRFYYNINQVPFSPHFAQLIVETRRRSDVNTVAAFIPVISRARLPGIEVVSRKLEQGPPVQAPVEVRLYGERFDRLHTAAVTVAVELESIYGTREVRHDLGPGARRPSVSGSMMRRRPATG